jgi:hypothetical protein
MSINERLLLSLVWLTFLASVSAAAWSFIEHPFQIEPATEPAYLVEDEQGNVKLNIDFTSEAYLAPIRFQNRLRNVILLAFLFSSKILILVHLRNARIRAWLFFVVVLCSFFWVWLRLESWTFWITETVCSKVLGDPLISLVISVVFFVRDNARPTTQSILSQVTRLPLELLLMVPWGFIWCVVQVFILGWRWI